VRRARWLLWAAIPAAVAVIAYAHRGALADALGLLVRARPAWVALALVAVASLYLCRAVVYAIPLRLMDYEVPRRFLWDAAVITSALQQALPSGGAAGYVFLAWALHRRGVPTGQASLIALVDTLSYAFATATLVVGSLGYLAFAGRLATRTVAVGFGPGALLLAVGVSVYLLQRDRDRFIPLVVGVGDRLGRYLRGRWRPESARRFLEEYYRGKAMIANHPGAFARMIALQYLAVMCDAAALWCTFAALGPVPPVWIVFLGVAVSLAAGAFVSAPAGGGGFEVVLSAFLVAHGVAPANAIAAALLFRLVGFWTPLAASAILLADLRRARADIRLATTPAAGGAPPERPA
jgi:glycosyltransferase 2 family protein